MKPKAPRNRTLTCDEAELDLLKPDLLTLSSSVKVSEIEDQIVCQDVFEAAQYFPKEAFDLLVLDPPYNLSKNYNGQMFREKEASEYASWFNSLIEILLPSLKPTATVYVCSDWKTSIIVAPILQKHLNVRNRITWEREKGRGAKSNWKNNTEDIWFCTMSDSYTFNVDDVKLKRKVIAPYRNSDGSPKDWDEGENGNYRLTHPSNIWTDISIPFWSMPENTDHPTQKPEKLIAKLLLASTKQGDLVLDPFLGSGTTAVVSRKLRRRFLGVEVNEEYCCWGLKRLKRAEEDNSIQGYSEGVFWERNSLADQPKNNNNKEDKLQQKALFT